MGDAMWVRMVAILNAPPGIIIRDQLRTTSMG
jgi:hypothetical protein